jgi:hypothetical protein
VAGACPIGVYPGRASDARAGPLGTFVRLGLTCIYRTCIRRGSWMLFGQAVALGRKGKGHPPMTKQTAAALHARARVAKRDRDREGS